MAWPSEPGAGVADQIVDLALSRPPTLGSGRLVCIDGPAGSGKTTLAGAVAGRTGARVVHLDDLYDGWTGLDALDRQLPTILDPLSQDLPGRFRRYDWARGAYAETVEVPPGPWLVLEGVGAGSLDQAARCTVLVVVTAPDDLRLARGVARDGEAARPHLVRWMAEEGPHLERDRVADRADVVVDGSRFPEVRRIRRTRA